MGKAECTPGSYTAMYGSCRDYKIGFSISGGVQLKVRLPGSSLLEKLMNEASTDFTNNTNAENYKDTANPEKDKRKVMLATSFLNPEVTFSRTKGVTGVKSTTEGAIEILGGFVYERLGLGTTFQLLDDAVKA